MVETSNQHADAEKAIDAGQISLMLVENDNYVLEMLEPHQTIIEVLIAEINEVLKNKNLKISGVVRIKYNITFPSIKATENSYNFMHHDYDEELDRKFVSVIYYANESDGDTFFFDENKNETGRITPKKGSAVIFDATKLHAGNNPRNFDTRKVINFIFCVADAESLQYLAFAD